MKLSILLIFTAVLVGNAAGSWLSATEFFTSDKKVDTAGIVMSDQSLLSGSYQPYKFISANTIGVSVLIETGMRVYALTRYCLDVSGSTTIPLSMVNKQQLWSAFSWERIVGDSILSRKSKAISIQSGIFLKFPSFTYTLYDANEQIGNSSRYLWRNSDSIWLEEGHLLSRDFVIMREIHSLIMFVPKNLSESYLNKRVDSMYAALRVDSKVNVPVFAPFSEKELHSFFSPSDTIRRSNAVFTIPRKRLPSP